MLKDYTCVTLDSNLKVQRLVMPNFVPRFHTCLGRGRSGYEMQSGNVTEGHICGCESVT